MSAAAVSLDLTVDDLKDGFAQAVDVGDTRLLVIRLGDEVRTVSRWCTHARSLLGEQEVDDGLIECSLHGAVFDTSDGSLQLGPTCSKLPVYVTSVLEDGSLVVELPDEPTTITPTSSFGSWGTTRA